MTDPFAGVRLSGVAPLIGSVAPLRLAGPRSPRPESHPERRRTDRCQIREEVLVRPLRADGTPGGRAFRAIVTELSAGGLRLFCDRPASPGPAAVRFGDGPDAAVRFVELTRLRKVPRGYEYAGAFKVAAPPVDAG